MQRMALATMHLKPKKVAFIATNIDKKTIMDTPYFKRNESKYN